jgi:protoporphyrinogen oxidase
MGSTPGVITPRPDNRLLVVLGGGPGGLAVGYYAKKNHIPFVIYEGESRSGGNCITLRHGEFLFDSGAHRFHDKIPDITREIKTLMGDDIVKIDVPSQIYFKKKLVDFPLSPLNLLKNLGLLTFIKAGLEVLVSKVKKKSGENNFEAFALRTYGKTIAGLFLLNYSEKLWGAPCSQLSPNVSGKRMKGLDLKTFLKEAVLGSKAKTEHLDGAFYYPRETGIGAITDRLEQYSGQESIRLNSRITRVFHNHEEIQAVEINGSQKVKTPYVVSTLPINRFLLMLDPSPPESVLETGRKLRFRNIVLVALFLDTESVTRAATVYFPGRQFPFTRLYEAKNRNPMMSPRGKTSVIVEIPCQDEDVYWKMEDHRLIDMVKEKLIEADLIEENKIIDAKVDRMRDAYPILELGFDNKIKTIFSFLKNFKNLRISGRNGKFLYTHVHDMMQFGRDIIDEYPFKKK